MEALCEEQRQAIDELLSQIVALKDRVSELEAQQKRNSQNSSKPPSSDPPWNKATQRRKRSGRRPGGQPGHPGAHRELLPADKVDEVVEHFPSGCDRCGAVLPPGLTDGDPARKQVFEIPHPRIIVTEHRIHGCTCPQCGARCVGRLGADVPPGAFGPRLEALTSYLGGAFRMSVRERVRLLDEFYGLHLSAATVKAIDVRVSGGLESIYEQALEWVRRACVAHADETSWPLGNVLGWLWTAVTEQISVFRIDARRSGDAFERLFGTGFDGILESDRLASYDRLPADRRQLCWAHLQRDFTRFAERPIPEVREFGQCGLFICERLFHAWHAFLEEHHDRARLKQELRPVRNDLGALLLTGALSPHPRVPGFSKHLLDRAEALFQFADVPGVVPTNNNAERALRPAVLWRKGSFGSRSPQGQRFVERILTVVASLRKQGRSVLDFLTEACSCHLHGLAPPSIVPVSP